MPFSKTLNLNKSVKQLTTLNQFCYNIKTIIIFKKIEYSDNIWMCLWVKNLELVLHQFNIYLTFLDFWLLYCLYCNFKPTINSFTRIYHSIRTLSKTFIKTVYLRNIFYCFKTLYAMHHNFSVYSFFLNAICFKNINLAI